MEIKNVRHPDFPPLASYESINYYTLAAAALMLYPVGMFFFFYALYGKVLWVFLFMGTFASASLFFLGRHTAMPPTFELYRDFMSITQTYPALHLAGNDNVNYCATEQFAVRRIPYQDIASVIVHPAYAEISIRGTQGIIELSFSKVPRSKREEARHVFSDKMRELGVLEEGMEKSPPLIPQWQT